MTDPNQGLMTLIRTKWGAQIAAACAGTAMPENFLAALIANETGGDQTKTRFEAPSFAEMCEVVAAKRAHFNNLGVEDLMPVQVDTVVTVKAGLFRLANFATSWGLTQIMGYQVIPFHRPIGILTDPLEHLKFAVLLLVQFANRWDLSLGEEGSGPGEGPGAVSPAPDSFEKLFACWNCGRPFPEKTFDPHYCANGLLRMSLYPPPPAPALESI